MYTLGFSFYKYFPRVGITTKFNKDMYAKMRSKKDEPLSNFGKRIVRVTGKGPPVTPSALVSPSVLSTETTRTTSPATSVKEIPIWISKRSHLIDKDKVDSHLSSVWDDAKLVVERAHEVVTAEDLKIFIGVPSNEIVACHVQKIVQVVDMTSEELQT